MFRLTTHSAIDQIAVADWNALVGDDLPFMRHEFLAALERHDCVGERFGWIPRHLALRDEQDRLLAAAPCYLKFNSYGEFVFDWAWADAWHRAGRRYYPKLVIASPYTPATGRRILTADATRRQEFAEALIRGSVQLAEQLQVSGLHWLFTDEDETAWMQQAGFMPRLGCQFHWHNQGYADFDDLLAAFSADKRKKIKRERRRVAEAGVHLRRIRGDRVTEAEWAVFHQLYEATFDKRGGIPTLSLGFFQELATTMGKQLLLVLAEHRGRIVAAAFCLMGSRSLYGRHWGCWRDFHSLHFEACYYQGLEACIEQGLQRFEPGAQGEHKIARGFLPTPTWSTHWIADADLRTPVGKFLEHETEAMEEHIAELHLRSPYRQVHDDGARPPTRNPAPVHAPQPLVNSNPN
ncbi:N-acetyltransferase [Thiohalocapsa marina]|uniref:N-acetyltransferase n=1 Tax=Thiohalocapsa marina TaxID=424902 RepID=A0A5M8FVA4_9GAMM|nr:GNAT family N-acetyltransferase [Thiohalocapsa marina]KAA6187740.1 N-acetyltransferase [Thiohalocapsa marina]